MNNRIPKNTGFIPNPFDARDYWEDEVVLGGAEIEIPQSYKIEGLTFEPQGARPFCVSMTATKMLETAYKKDGFHRGLELSKPHLYYNSGGSYVGSWFRATLETARTKGCIKESLAPMPEDITSWNRAIYEKEKRQYTQMGFMAPVKLKGYIRIKPDRDSLRRAIINHGGLMVGVYANGGWWTEGTARKSKTDNHAVYLVGWTVDGRWIVFDSLQRSTDFDGYHTVSANYGFHSAYAITELPDNAKDLVDEAREPPTANEERYGKPRNFEAEVAFAAEMQRQFKAFNNQSVLDASGRFWEMYIRAGVYGGYNLSYRKLGMWKPGDLINDCYFWRRTGKHWFDFNKTRDNQ